MLALAAICWTLSLASRLSLGPGIAVIALLSIRHVWRHLPARRIAGTVAIVIPILAGGVLLAAYNLARFHSIAEFGLRYQLAGANQHKMAVSEFASLHYVIPNLLNYVLSAPVISQHFHYFYASTPRWTAALFHLSQNYRVEPLVGIVWTQPLLVLALASLPWKPADPAADWLRWSLWTAALLGFAPVLLIRGATMRYLIDVIPSLTILAALGYWQLLDRFENRPGFARELQAVVRLIVVVECVMGLLIPLQV
jgi:hypothetical protein